MDFTRRQLGLSAEATLYVFNDRDEMIETAVSLMRCHPHHFSVMADLPGGAQGLVVSPRALACMAKLRRSAPRWETDDPGFVLKEVSDASDQGTS